MLADAVHFMGGAENFHSCNLQMFLRAQPVECGIPQKNNPLPVQKKILPADAELAEAEFATETVDDPIPLSERELGKIKFR